MYFFQTGKKGRDHFWLRRMEVRWPDGVIFAGMKGKHVCKKKDIKKTQWETSTELASSRLLGIRAPAKKGRRAARLKKCHEGRRARAIPQKTPVNRRESMRRHESILKKAAALRGSRRRRGRGGNQILICPTYSEAEDAKNLLKGRGPVHFHNKILTEQSSGR